MAFGLGSGIGLGLGLISSIPQWLTGDRQQNRADDLSEGLQRPWMDIPESQMRALQSAEAQAALTRLPGQGAIEGQLDQTTANQIAMIERMGVGGPTSINAASRAYSMQQEKENQLGIAAAGMRLNNQQILRDELGDQAGWEQQQWNWNERMPYEGKVRAIEALREGALRNKNAAWKNIFGMGANIFGGMDDNDGGEWWKSILGDNNTTVGDNALPQNEFQPNAYEAQINKSPEQKRVFELMWGGPQ